MVSELLRGFADLPDVTLNEYFCRTIEWIIEWIKKVRCNAPVTGMVATTN